MRTLLAALTCLMLFATPVVAGDLEHAVIPYNAGDFKKAFRPFKPHTRRTWRELHRLTVSGRDSLEKDT
jgi:hypothetical protein